MVIHVHFLYSQGKRNFNCLILKKKCFSYMMTLKSPYLLTGVYILSYWGIKYCVLYGQEYNCCYYCAKQYKIKQRSLFLCICCHSNVFIKGLSSLIIDTKLVKNWPLVQSLYWKLKKWHHWSHVRLLPKNVRSILNFVWHVLTRI